MPSDAAPSHRPKPAPRWRERLRRTGPLLAVLAVLLPLWSFAGWFSLLRPRELEAAQQRELAAASRAAAALSAAVLQRAQAGLRTLDFWLATHPGTARPDETVLRHIGELMRDQNLRLLDLALLDRRGQILPLTAGLPDAPGKLADRPLLAALRRQADPGEAALQLGLPLRLPGEPDRPRLALALPVSAPHSELIGVLALLDLDRLARQLSDFAEAPHEQVLLMRSDGVVLAQSPGPLELLGRNAFRDPGLQRADFAGHSGAFTSDGDPRRRGAYQSLPGFDLQLLLLMAAPDDALRAYRAERAVLLALSAAFSLAVLAAGLLFARSAQRARLRDAQERAAVDASPVGLFRCGLDGRLTYANETFHRLLGFSDAAELMPWGWLSLLPQPQRDEARRHWVARMGRREAAQFQRPLRIADGRTRLLALRTAPLLLDDGTLLGQAGTLEDVTERETQEQARAALLTVFNRLPDAVLQLNPAGQIVYANAAARERLALPAEGSLHGVSYPQLCTRERVYRYFNEMLPAALRDGLWQGCDKLPDPRTGLDTPTEQLLFVHRGRQGQLALVTLLMRAPAAARPAAQEPALPGDAAPVMLAILDTRQRCLFVHEALARHHGVRREAWLSQPIAALLDEAEYATCRPAIEDALAGRTRELRRRFETRQGPQLSELQYAPLQAASGAVEGVIITARHLSGVGGMAGQAGTGLLDGAGFEQQLAAQLQALQPSSSGTGDDAAGGAPGEAPGDAPGDAPDDTSRPLCLLRLEIDGLDQALAQHGPAVADAALKAVALRLRHALRPRDLLGQQDDQGFLVFVSGLRREGDADIVAARLAAALAMPVRIGQNLLNLGVSIGRCVARPGEGKGEGEAEGARLLAAAEASLRQARLDSGASPVSAPAS